MENTKKTRLKKKHWFFLIDAAVTLIVILIVIILLRYKPDDYSALAASKQEANVYLTNRLIPSFYNGMQSGEPFELIINQEGINEAVTSFGWPQIYNDVMIFNPAVTFSDSIVGIVSMINYNGMDMVFSVEIYPEMNEQGQLQLRIDKAKIGALGVTFLLKQVAKRMYNEQVQTGEPDNIVSSALASLMKDEPFEPVFDFDNKKARVDRIVVEKASLKIRFTPIPESAISTR